ncbi:DUF7024 domain-containing protein [Acidovorax sp. SDU_ACID1]|uniref:DUF7024 domain-containing protein n=1 Tax=Acidovorax sp. SDU_ACID1 TaxID=3136632 RepID=UPI003872D330
MQSNVIGAVLKSKFDLSNRTTIILGWAIIGLMVMAWALAHATPAAKRVLYSDQATHVMIADSLWNDGDLKYSLDDLRRFSLDYPQESGPRGLFLKQGTAGELFYAKPYIYGMVAAPFHAALGMDGFIVLNVLCLLVIGSITAFALKSALAHGWSFIASLAFVVPSAFFPWVFVAHPDIFIAALLAAGTYLLLSVGMSGHSRVFGALILGAALHEKIPFLVVIPFIILAIPDVGWRRRSLIGSLVVVSWFVFSGVNLAIDGSLLSYQGLRLYVRGAPFPLEDGWIPPTKGITGHVFDPLGVAAAIVGNLSLLPTKIADFLVGRQTGIIPYFTVAASLLIMRPAFTWQRSALVLVGFFAYMVLQWLVFPTNGYGGAGSYGSRYMMQALPLIPLAFIGAKYEPFSPKPLAVRRWTGVFLLGTAILGMSIQYRLILPGNEAVMRYWRVNFVSPLNFFRLEEWLLPTVFSGFSDKYVEEVSDGYFKIFKTDKINESSWPHANRDDRRSNFLIYKMDKERKFPPVTVATSVDASVRILSGGRVVWSGAVLAGQNQAIEIDSAVPFRHAFDMLFKKHIALAALVVEADDSGEKEPVNPTLHFHEDTRPFFEGTGKRLTVGELVAQGAELRKGWSHIEPWGVWSDGDMAEISFRVGKGGAKYEAELDLRAYVPGQREALDVELRCSGGGSRHVRFENDAFKLVNLPCEKSRDHEYVLVNAKIRNPTSPLAEGRGVDPRRLGIGLNAVRIERID